MAGRDLGTITGSNGIVSSQFSLLGQDGFKHQQVENPDPNWLFFTIN